MPTFVKVICAVNSKEKNLMEFTCTFDLTGKDFDARARDEAADILQRLTRDVTRGKWAGYMHNSRGKQVGFWEARSTGSDDRMKEVFCGYCDCDTLHSTNLTTPEMECSVCYTVRYDKVEEELPDCGRR